MTAIARAEKPTSRYERVPWRTLDHPLDDATRVALERSLRGLLAWQKTLGRFPRLSGAPDATPFVTLYSGARIRGCFGSEEGGADERLGRAFLRALEDARHGGAASADRGGLVAQVSYLRDVSAPKSLEEAMARLEPGTHGVAVVRPGAPFVLLIPSTARDGSSGARALFEILARKAGVSLGELRTATFFLFEADEVVARPEASLDRSTRRSSAMLAAQWLRRLVREDGFVHFGVDPRARTVEARGLMQHGRAAVVVRALARAGRAYAADAARARAWLDGEIRRALRGEAVEGWPAERDRAAGTIALACLAGLPLQAELAHFVGMDSLAGSSWHAAQVVAALGRGAPAPLWDGCVAGLATKPWAPWTAIAARARRDDATFTRAARTIERSLRANAPHAGGAGVTDVPELALTAVAVEALAPIADASSVTREAVASAQRFLARWQHRPDRIPAALDPDLAAGAFPLSPVAPYARGDVTAHALLALDV